MLAIMILTGIVAFDISLAARAWRANRIKQRRAQRVRAMSGVIVRGGR
ncbi:MAG: hypothetical protein WBQ86_09545 [Candidatus Binatus sp.]